MRTFAEKPKATQQTKPAKSTKASPTPSGQRDDVHSMLQLQRMIGNQAVQRLLRTDAESQGIESSTTATAGFAHDLSRIPVHSMKPVRIQPKLAVNAPGDIYEQEADRVAERVLRMPEPQLQQNACPCGGGCPKCQTVQQNHQHERLEANRVRASDTEQVAAPPIVHEVSAGPGQPLDLATRAFFEPRFRHDFSHVRVHTDSRATDSARALNARAFTLGSNIVFGAGLYEPETSRGRRLVAHELTHVVQQNQTAGQHIQRQEDNEKDSRFKRVPPGPGAYTKDEYKEWLRLHPESAFSLGGPWEPKSFHARYTPEWFSSRGYFYSGSMYGGYRGARIEVWLSNEGKGKEFRVFRGPEPERREPSEESKRVVPAEKSRQNLKEEHVAIKELQFYVEEYMERKEYFIERSAELRYLQGSPDYRENYYQFLNDINEFQDTFNYILGERIPELVGEIDPQDQQALHRMGEYITVLEEFYTWKSKDIVDLFRDLPAPSTK